MILTFEVIKGNFRSNKFLCKVPLAEGEILPPLEMKPLAEGEILPPLEAEGEEWWRPKGKILESWAGCKLEFYYIF